MGIYTEGADAYLLRSVGNNFAGISKISADGLTTTGIITQGPKIEGPAVFRLANGTYYLWGSHLTGWAPNPAWLSRSSGTTLSGASWVDMGNPSGSATTFDRCDAGGGGAGGARAVSARRTLTAAARRSLDSARLPRGAPSQRPAHSS